MHELERERLRLNIKKLEVSKEELKFKILERQEDIKRLEYNIEQQDQKILELKEELKGEGHG